MLRSIETGLLDHHNILNAILMKNFNSQSPSQDLNREELNVIALDEAFKNNFILLIVGVFSSILAFIWEIVYVKFLNNLPIYISR